MGSVSPHLIQAGDEWRHPRRGWVVVKRVEMETPDPLNRWAGYVRVYFDDTFARVRPGAYQVVRRPAA